MITNAVTTDNLNAVMGFDHPIQVHADGTVTDNLDGIYAPNLTDETLDDDKWSLFTHGYTGAHGYNGPVMHNSEYIGGRLARDILATPGIYVAVVAYWTRDDDADTDADTDADNNVEGWAIARLNAENDAPAATDSIVSTLPLSHLCDEECMDETHTRDGRTVPLN